MNHNTNSLLLMDKFIVGNWKGIHMYYLTIGNVDTNILSIKSMSYNSRYKMLLLIIALCLYCLFFYYGFTFVF